MPKLKPGAITVDLVDGSIHGDLDHCPKEDLLESAQALLSLLPQVKHKGLWGLGKAYDAECHLYTAAKQYRPPADLHLEADMSAGWASSAREFHLQVIGQSDRETYWRFDRYSRLVGSVQGDQVTPDTEGKPDHYRPPERPSSAPQTRRSCPNCAVDLVADGERPWVKTCPQCDFALVGIPPGITGPRSKKQAPSPPEVQQLKLPI